MYVHIREGGREGEREREKEREMYWSGMAAEHIKAIGSCPSTESHGSLLERK